MSMLDKTTTAADDADVEGKPSRGEATKGYSKLLNATNTFKSHFSSTPLDPEATSNFSDTNSGLTDSERTYLETLLKKGDPTLIERASQRLCDPMLFPPLSACTGRQNPPKSSVDAAAAAAAAAATAAEEALAKNQPKRRNSQLQQELFRLHEENALQPSHLLKRLNLVHKNSILDSADFDDLDAEGAQGEPSESPDGPEMVGDLAAAVMDSLNPFKDVSSWLDGSQGVEVSGTGVPLPKSKASQQHDPFRILGTAADDASCHPHVLSPPLMESLLAFVPEALSRHNFWLKYSLVRDGSGLFTMLRQVRASDNTFLAIETTDGHVFGSFTCQPWRLAQGWYKNMSHNQESFLWKMRRSRLETTQSIMQQACQEAEIQVYPYRTGNVAVQYCSKDHLMLGQGEMLLSDAKQLEGKHYGHGLFLDSSLQTGSTSNCETFGNPCLVDSEQRGARFAVSNLEVWTLTPHRSVHDAEQSELSTLFLDGARDGTDNLNIMNILVGGPI